MLGCVPFQKLTATFVDLSNNNAQHVAEQTEPGTQDRKYSFSTLGTPSGLQVSRSVSSHSRGAPESSCHAGFARPRYCTRAFPPRIPAAFPCFRLQMRGRWPVALHMPSFHTDHCWTLFNNRYRTLCAISLSRTCAVFFAPAMIFGRAP